MYVRPLARSFYITYGQSIARVASFGHRRYPILLLLLRPFIDFFLGGRRCLFFFSSSFITKKVLESLRSVQPHSLYSVDITDDDKQHWYAKYK